VERPFLRIAHRGFAAIGRDNALESISAALRLGADMIEVDVRLSSAGRIVLDHDDADAPGAPLLRDALDLIAAAGAGVLLDLKVPGIPGAIARLLDEHAPDVPVVASGNAQAALHLKHEHPSVRAGRTYPQTGSAAGIPIINAGVGAWHRHNLARDVARVVAGFDVLVSHYRALSLRAIDGAHARGVDVFAWTVDGRDLVERLRAMGVDGVICDDPRSFGL
jgi:glycerophosphoryl diester phosphodiesterase